MISFFRNVVLLPLTAGRLIKEGSSYRDGSIATGVLLAVMTALCQQLSLCKLAPSTDIGIIYINFTVVILGLHILGLVTCQLGCAILIPTQI